VPVVVEMGEPMTEPEDRDDLDVEELPEPTDPAQVPPDEGDAGKGDV
jgi:hypothetical protein